MLHVSDFSLRHTIESGQPLTFYSRYSNHAGTEHLAYVTSEGEINLSLKGDRLSYRFNGNYTQKTAKNEVISRLGLDDNLPDIYRQINTDIFMAGAIKGFYGMRITKNDPWEASLCFVISQFNNLKRIRGIIGNMVSEFGEDLGGTKLFPSAQALASADLSSIRACGTGFRDKYVKSVAEQFAFSFDKRKPYKMGYEDAKEKLMELDGIGDKVADCILLFGYNKLDAFPIDTWVKRVMERVYFNGRKRTIKRLHKFALDRWPKSYLGYAQQYIFWRGR
ncbi:MAG: DNA-3-methyladenine glycosylase 2, partial [Candidatus Micrarchaeota archaeon]|nr:DNA-3-methyladenine glycosylase 2 [Candidatus Micrarchaeota archaeon]